MDTNSLGMIETKGLIGAIEAADLGVSLVFGFFESLYYLNS